MESLEEYVYNLLDEKQSGYFVYHNKEHTQQVFSFAMEIAEMEGIPENDASLLKAAALLHDVGYTVSTTDHEENSCIIAEEILPKYDYKPSQIKAICKMIMATKIPQKPTNHLSKILCDADLSYMGTDKYFREAEKLYLELKNMNPKKTKEEWLHQQINFLTAHHYFTQTANKQFKNKKNKNLSALKAQLPEKKLSVIHKLNIIKEDVILILIGILISSFALKSFLVPNSFFDGGISGVSLLIHKIFNFNLAYVVLIANLPFIFLARKIIGNPFAIKTAICIVLLSLCLYFIPFHPVLKTDNILVSIFGGFFLGIGNGLILRAGCTLDGIDIFALYTRRRTSFTTTEIVFVINFIIFLIAAIRFDIKISMYSMITYFTASKTVDYVVEGIEAYTGVTIISGKSEILKSKLVNELGRGITIYKGERGYLPGNFEVHNDTDIIFTV
ncbi:MAG TPA: YitT family protein, partial [Parafilimonas sp.]